MAVVVAVVSVVSVVLVVLVVAVVGEMETSSVIGQLLRDCLEGLPVVSIQLD